MPLDREPPEPPRREGPRCATEWFETAINALMNLRGLLSSAKRYEARDLVDLTRRVLERIHQE